VKTEKNYSAVNKAMLVRLLKERDAALIRMSAPEFKRASRALLERNEKLLEANAALRDENQEMRSMVARVQWAARILAGLGESGKLPAVTDYPIDAAAQWK